MTESENKKIVILGAGESGIGAALLAKKKGFEVFVSDKGAIQEQYEEILTTNQIDFEEGRHTEGFILGAHEIVKSPGIPGDIPILTKARENNIPIISEIEFASRYTRAKTIAITGSNGKTTTALLIYHLLQTAGYKVSIAGNMGDSFAKKVLEEEPDYWVLEVSSFQLDDAYQFKPTIAILLNITPDHLDRYENNFQNYVNSKFKLIQNTDADTSFIYFKDNPAILREIKKRKIVAEHLPISLEEEVESGAAMKGGLLEFDLKKAGYFFSLKESEINLKGKHNMVNVMAATLACIKLGIEREILKTYFKTFKGVEHRLEEVIEINGIKFINDSKATNIDSVYYALDSFTNPIVWIAGGVDKGNDYSKIKELVLRKVKFLICLGYDTKLIDMFKNEIHIIFQTNNMRDAVEQAYELATEGDIIMLSPACASFDLFKDYEDRGNQFKKAVTKLSKLAVLKKK